MLILAERLRKIVPGALVGAALVAAQSCTLNIRSLDGDLSASGTASATPSPAGPVNQPVAGQQLGFHAFLLTSEYARTNWHLQPQVRLLDGSANIRTTQTSAVTLAAYTDAGCTTPASGALTASQNPLPATAGVAAFSQVQYNGTGTIYVGASAPDYPPVCTGPVTLTGPTLGITQTEGASAFGYAKVGMKSYVAEYAVYNSAGKASGCSAPTLTNTTDFAIVQDNCGTADLDHLHYCTIQVQAAPQSGGTKNATLSRTCTVGGTVNQSLQVIGLTSTTVALETNSTVGTNHCTVESDGTVLCWGYQHALGYGSTALYSGVPQPVAGISNIVQVTMGGGFGCARDLSGSVFCWGGNSNNETSAISTSTQYSAVQVPGITTAIDITAGQSSACAVLADYTVRCWGHNGWGVLGDGTTTTRASPVQVSGLTDAKQMSMSGTKTCALRNSGTISCWGWNGTGYLGDGTYTDQLTPVTNVSGITTAVKISAEGNHSCAVLANGTIQCWGNNFVGELGKGNLTSSLTPTPVVGITTAVDVSVGPNYTCALLSDGTDRCWGANIHGRFGDGTLSYTLSPTATLSGTGIIGISTTQYDRCVLKSNNRVYCVGTNANSITDRSVVGSGLVGKYPLPREVPSLANLVQASLSPKSGCAVRPDGTVQCWGYNFYGQLGNNTDNYPGVSLTPVTVSGITTATLVHVSEGDFACAVLADQTARCWGFNSYGRLGDGTTTNSKVPVTVSGLSGVAELALGSNFACARLTGGGVRCWGNAGSLGDGSSTQSPVPVAVTGITNAVSITAGQIVTCAALATGEVKCWGYGNYGALGDGTSGVNQTSPVTVTGINDAVRVVAGRNHVCALRGDQTVWCWGNGASTVSNVPVKITALSGVTELYSGAEHLCARDGAGLRCWGGNNVGELGSLSGGGITPVRPYLPGITQVFSGFSAQATFFQTADGKIYGTGQDDHALISLNHRPYRFFSTTMQEVSGYRL